MPMASKYGKGVTYLEELPAHKVTSSLKHVIFEVT